MRKYLLFTPFSEEDLRFMERFKVGEMTIDPGTTVLMEGSNSPQIFTALHGMGVRYKLLEDGRRQVINFIFPGDFIGLQAAVMGEMQHSVAASSSMTLCVFDRKEFWTFFKSSPERAFDVTWLSAVEEHFLGEALAAIGQRSAMQAVAWSLTRIMQRGAAIGLARNRSMPLPYRQQDLADALGLSLVHTNKTLARLRELQLATWSDGKLTVSDLEALAERADMTLEDLPQRPLM